MKLIPLKDRPREKILTKGSAALGDSELLAILLSSGNKEKGVLELSNEILNKYDLEKLSSLNISSLQKISGIGLAKACQICSCFELGRRASLNNNGESLQIKTSKDAISLLAPKMKVLKSENFVCLYLNSRKKLIKEKTIFVGTLNESVVHPREIFKQALDEGAAAIILAHNHPSGDPTPSKEDIEITKELISAGEILGIRVLDHVIIGNEGSWSMADSNSIF